MADLHMSPDKRKSNRRIALSLLAVAVVVYLAFVASGVVGSMAGG